MRPLCFLFPCPCMSDSMLQVQPLGPVVVCATRHGQTLSASMLAAANKGALVMCLLQASCVCRGRLPAPEEPEELLRSLESESRVERVYHVRVQSRLRPLTQPFAI